MKTKSFLIISVVLALASLLVTPASALFVPTTGQGATRVLGQPDFTSNAGNTTQDGMQSPADVAVDPTTQKVFVVDFDNNRVLRFADVTALTDGAAAEAVLGQPNFTSSAPQTTQNGMFGPHFLIVDVSGRLWVSEGANSRVLRFDNAAAKANGANADGVLGQPNFISNNLNSPCETTPSDMCGPAGLAFDSTGRLWVADSGNSRVLRFDNAAAKANGGNADAVLGQSNFTSYAANFAQNGMASPGGLAVDTSGRLWVADSLRVLRFDNAAAKANGANADGVLLQPNFVSTAPATTQSGTQGALDTEVDTSGRLYVSDSYNNRVLVFDAAASLPDGANASSVLGQQDFITGSPNTGGISDATLSFPFGLSYDPAADVLWLADAHNNRVLMYAAPNFRNFPFIGLVNRFLPPGTINVGKIQIRTRDGSIHFFDVTHNTRILPALRAGQLGCGSFVTILAQGDPSTNQWVALRIIVHPAESGPGPASPTCVATETPTATATPAGVATPIP